MEPWLGLRVEVTGEENLTIRRPCVYVANHQSFVDAAVLGRIYPAETVLVGKKELRHFPLFGWIYVTTGNILIDRSNHTSAIQRMMDAAEAVRSRGVSVWMFPEGTRGDRPGDLLPFRKGAFHLAIAGQVPLVPIVVSPLEPLISVRHFRIRPGTVRVAILEPIETDGLTHEDVSQLLQKTRERMLETLRNLESTPAKPRNSD